MKSGKTANTPAPAAGTPKGKIEGTLSAEAGVNEVGLTVERDGIEFSLTLPRKVAKQFANDILDAAKTSKQ